MDEQGSASAQVQPLREGSPLVCPLQILENKQSLIQLGGGLLQLYERVCEAMAPRHPANPGTLVNADARGLEPEEAVPAKRSRMCAGMGYRFEMP